MIRTADLAADRARALALTPVSRETEERLDRFVALLLTWQRTTQLVALPRFRICGPAISPIRCSSSALAPDATLGRSRLRRRLSRSGHRLRDCRRCREQRVHLVESNAKKAAFLREAVRVTGAPAEVHPTRIENFVESFDAARSMSLPPARWRR